MRSTTVVFRGIGQVVEAYEANDIGPWAIANGDCILCADNVATTAEGRQSLEETLERLHRGNSRAQFDLRVYKIPADQEITSKTPHLRGFRFSLYEDSEMTPYEHGRKKGMEEYDGKFQVMQQEIAELKLALAKAEEEEVSEERDNSIGAIIGGLLEMPAIKQALQFKLVGLIDKIIPMNTQQRPAAIAGIEGQSLLDADQQQKVQQAVNILCTKDARLGDHLLGVARIAAENPGQYALLVNMLK
jgi:hypothetical protein